MENSNLQQDVELIKKDIGSSSHLVIRDFYIGSNDLLEAKAIFIHGRVDKKIIDSDVLKPLMQNIHENLKGKVNLAEYIVKRYISMSQVTIEKDINIVIKSVKRGKTAILVRGTTDYIIIDAEDGEYRNISEPENEVSIKGAKEGFVENLDTNITLIKRRIKDNNLINENFIVGQRTQSDLAIMYMEDIVDKDILEDLRKRINAIEVDGVISMGIFQQYIEDYTYTLFPQTFSTERVDIAVANILEGKIIVLLEGSGVTISVPSVFIQFFQAVEDYNFRTVVASFSRLLRILAAITVITLPSIYLTLIKYNVELIPIKFVTPIVQSRVGIALTPFLEIIAMELIVEFLREGGLRLPSKIAQTLSLVGGIIIGDTAIKSKIVSPTTLLIVGITVVATFLIPSYDMSLCVRTIRFPMLILANMMGILGIAVGWFFILTHISALDSFGVPYFDLRKEDLKDTFVRGPMWKMNNRPSVIPNNNTERQKNFRDKFRRK